MSTKLSENLRVNKGDAHTQVDVDMFGQVKIEGVDFSGQACSLIGDKLVRAVGGKAGSGEKKPEFYQSSKAKATQKNW